MTDDDRPHISEPSMSGRQIDARDVLDPNARTTRNFRARVVGHFRRVGPNAWDNYVFEPIAGGAMVDVLADVPVEVEAEGTAFRMRRHGEVERLVWVPDAPEDGAPADAAGGEETAERRARFLAECVRAFSEAQGLGGAAVIAGKLRSTPPKPSLD